MRSTATVSTRPRYGLLDVIGLLFRELGLMILIFLVVFAIGAAAVLTIKKTYVAGATIYAGAGQEYVYQSRVGTLTVKSSGFIWASSRAGPGCSGVGGCSGEAR